MPPFLLRYTGGKEWKRLLVSMPSRADISFLRDEADSTASQKRCVNALSGLSCYADELRNKNLSEPFQCPHGLELLLFEWMRQNDYLIVSMPSRAYTSFLQVLLLSS